MVNKKQSASPNGFLVILAIFFLYRLLRKKKKVLKTRPTMTIATTTSTVTSDRSTKVSPMVLTFTSSEPTTNFVKTDITIKDGDNVDVNNNVLSTLSVSADKKVYTTTLTPTENVDKQYNISVAADQFTDAAGNKNAASNTFIYKYDPESPLITSTTIKDDNSSIDVKFSEAVFKTDSGSGDLEVSDFELSLSGGAATLRSTDSISKSATGNVYTLGITLSGTANGSETLTVKPIAKSIYDAAGNVASTSQSNNTVNLKEKIRPTMQITAKSSYGNNVVSDTGSYTRPITLTFTSSEPTEDFDRSDITITKWIPEGAASSNQDLSILTPGDLTASADKKTYTTILTPAAGHIQYDISVAVNKFTDAVGNKNTASTFIYKSLDPLAQSTSPWSS